MNEDELRARTNRNIDRRGIPRGIGLPSIPPSREVHDEGPPMTESAYTVEVRENGRRVSHERIVDPFVHTTVHIRGWRNALRVLFRRYETSVLVGGERKRVERVMELDPDYLGPPGSPSRKAWDAQLAHALANFQPDESGVSDGD